MSGILFEVTIVICLAALFSILFRILRQPPILAYILTGILIGPFGQLQLQNHEGLRMMAQFGITLLLFMLGLELKLKDLRSIGKAAFLIGIPQIATTTFLGYFIAARLGFLAITSFYIGVALAFSSTIIIIKLISSKRDLQSLYGKISVGILLIQDLFAVFVLMFLSMFTKGQESFVVESIALILIKACFLFAIVIALSKYVFPKLMDWLSKSEETLLLFSLAWVLGLSALVSSYLFGFSIEVAGFLAGVALANANENFHIISRVRALQDFFITIFFVVLGLETASGNIGAVIGPAVILSLFVFFGKPLIIMLIMGLLGYRKRTLLFTGVHLAQISEFSFIIIFLGSSLGHVTNDIVMLITIVGLLSFAASTYASIYTNSIYRFLGKYLHVFELGKIKKEFDSESELLDSLEDHVTLVGANRMGKSILDALLDEGEKVVVIDFDPDIVRELKERGVISIFGDISDTDIQERVKLHKARLVISTISDPEDNMLLLDGLRRSKNNAKVIVVAADFDDAKKLYDAGADYVVVPHVIGGKHLAKMIKENTLEKIDGKRSSKDLMRLN